LDWNNILNFHSLAREFITLFVVIDPIGTIPVYLFAISSVPQKLHKRFAIHAVMISMIVLLAFLAGGQILLESLGLRLGSFQIAGGIVLFLFALSMIFGDSKPETEIEAAGKNHLDGAVFPLAIPSIASPGAMLAVVVLTDNHSHSIAEQAVTGAIVVMVLISTLLVLLSANLIYKVIGNAGASVISRVMGIVLTTIAVDAILGGLGTLGIIQL
jgi:multiple antibiotic resistance protein